LLGLALTLEAMPEPREAERYFHMAMAAGEKQARVDYGLFLFKQGRGAEGAEALRQAGATAELERVTKALRNAPPAAADKRERHAAVRAVHAQYDREKWRYGPEAFD